MSYISVLAAKYISWPGFRTLTRGQSFGFPMFRSALLMFSSLLERDDIAGVSYQHLVQSTICLSLAISSPSSFFVGRRNPCFERNPYSTGPLVALPGLSLILRSPRGKFRLDLGDWAPERLISYPLGRYRSHCRQNSPRCLPEPSPRRREEDFKGAEKAEARVILHSGLLGLAVKSLHST